MKKYIIIIFSVSIITLLSIILLLPKEKPNNEQSIEEQLNFYFTDVAIELKKNETYQTKLAFENDTSQDIKIDFSSNNSSIATINENGLITAIDYGVAIITASYESEVITSIEVNVVEEEIIAAIEPIIQIERLDINEENITINSNQKYQLNTTIYPNNATNKNLIYETNDSRIAEVTDDGLVVGRVAGTTTINVYSDNEKTDAVNVNVKAPIVSLDSITLMPSEVILNIGENYQVKPTLLPANINSKIEWTSSNTSIATVSSGLITAKKEGKAVITAICEGKKSNMNITVKNEKLSVIVTNIDFDKESVVIEADQTIKINANVFPNNATNKGLIWSSSNNSIATVSNDGTIKGVSKGTTTITAKSINGITETINVTVTSSTTSNSVVTPTEIILSTNDFSLQKGKTKQLRATIIPINAINQEITWTSSDEGVATVSSNGLVTAKKIGEATIAAITSNGKVARAVVKVIAKPITPETRASYYGNGNLPESTISVINQHLYDYLEEAAYRARKSGKISQRKAKVAAAAYFMVFNPYYKVPYGYGGLSKYNYQGWNPIWSNTIGVECLGFVTWSLIQAGLPLGTDAQYYPAGIEQIEANSYWTVDHILRIPGLQVGDILNKRYPRDSNNNKVGNGHWAVIIDIDKKNCTLTVAHATSVKEGLHLSTYKCGTTVHYNRAFNTDKY